MNRRHFLRNGLWVTGAAIGFPAIVRGVPPMKDPAFLGGLNKPVAAAGGGPTFKQYVSLESQVGFETFITSPALSLASGDCVIAMIGGSQAASGVSADGQALTSLRTWLAESYYISLWYLLDASLDASAPVTVTYSPSSGFRHISCAVYSGVATSSAADGDNTKGSTLGTATTDRTSANITTTNANDLLVGMFLNWDFDQVATAAEGWTKRSGDSSQMATFVEKVVSSTGTYPSGNFATVPSVDEYIGFITAWKSA